MKQNEISLNSLLIDSDRFLLTDEEIGDNHVATSTYAYEGGCI